MTTIISILILFAFLIGLIVKGESALTSVISTDKGLVRGEILTTVKSSHLQRQYAAFKGIPYAKPPVNDLRFKPPVEKETWTGVLNATSEGSMCIQFNSADSTVVGSEDCLYINIFTPHTQFNKSVSKPVMVWIFGGSYMTGNSNASYYGPDFLLEEDVIVVSFNYRLGALGFLNLNHENASGNCGLKDQNFALKWVQKNIANFGGNPDKVTIFGQSAGSVCVDLHVLSDMSTGLFSQSISMSGSPLSLYWGFQTSTEAEAAAFRLGSKLGTNALNKEQLLEALYKASAVDIVKQTNGISLIPFRPTIESTTIATNQEKFLTECSLKKYFRGNYNKGPHIMGFTPSETLMFAGSAIYLSAAVNAVLATIKTAMVPIDLPFLTQISSMTPGAISNLTKPAMYQLIKETTDLLYVVGIDSKQQLLRIHNEYPIYYYRFSFDTNYSLHRTLGVNLDGVGHADDLPYIFYMPFVKLPLNQSDIAMTRRRMVRLWTNFAKYGNPTPYGSIDTVLKVTWPDSGILGRHLEITSHLTVGARPTDDSVKTYELAGLGVSPILNDCYKLCN